ncbi:hypothetical protein DUI87_22371 [Hirundo rustica rustica]|uniref:Uncharacterized protein n=1 Tax=Hirundo rustica rustica TaxID=333673 RepID=A0A3M0JK89_HIRRU|nr:hypothetical protein DUI87_22371 [Hirundo rustica rustica]
MLMEENAIPSCWVSHGGQDTTTSCRSLAAAPHRTSSRDGNTMYRSRIPVRVSSLVSTGIQRPSQQPAATQGQAHSRPVTAPSGKQDPELPLPLLEENISSMPPPGPGKSEKDLSVVSQTEPSHVLRTSTRVSRRASQDEA